MDYIPYGRQDIRDEDVKAVVDVLTSKFITQGPEIDLFEADLAKYTSANYCTLVNSATSALHLACLALDVGPGDIVWTSPISFVASSNCALCCGASVDFVDINPETFNMCSSKLEQKLSLANEKNKLPKVVICVHMAGQSCDMKAISSLCKKYKIKLIEDASHAIGGKYQNEAVGSCKYSDITVFSFHPVKIVTTGEGGALLTNSRILKDKINLLRTHGITKKESLFKSSGLGPWYYEQQELGYNYRMTDIQAALGRSQLKRIDDYIQKRNDLANIYNTKLKGLPLVTPKVVSNTLSSYHLYIIQLENDQQHLSVFESLRAKNIGVNLHYIPIHTQPYYREKLGFKVGDFPVAENYAKRAISLPLFPLLENEEQDYICETIVSSLGL